MDIIYHIICLIKRYLGFNDDQHVEDQYYQAIHDQKYDEALRLAQKHQHLDQDLVYKCKWRNSSITVHSIINVLGNIQDKLWAINESVQTVPISYEACKTLIEFGLKESNLKLMHQLECELENKKPNERPAPLDEDLSDEYIEGLIDFNNLNERQKELRRCRQYLLSYKRSLLAYEKILGDYRTVKQHFDHVFYDEFRRKCPLNVCIDYANEGDANAVEILLNFYTDDLESHLLTILSNFPETLSPYQYRNLLPCLRDGEDFYVWRSPSGKIECEDQDWSGHLETDSDSYEKQLYENNEHLKKYLCPLNDKLLSQWFIERALEIERRTLLLTCAIQLLHLGSEINIKNLKKTQDDLTEFDRIVYDCPTDDNLYLSFSDFQAKPEIERLILMIGDSTDGHSSIVKDRWERYYKLGMQADLKDAETKYKLLALALAYCDDPDGRLSTKMLNHIIDVRKRDERIQLAYLQLNT